MSNLDDKLHHIAALQAAIADKGTLPQEVLRRVEYKFRLECNYHSNRIEGGTLTKQETRSVMIGNITVKNKPLKDIREMSGHDETMQQILRIGKAQQRLSESRIKTIHQAIIVPEHPEDAQEIGTWKIVGNHVLNYKGERFDFTAPEDVAKEIHALLNWVNTGLDHIEGNKKQAPHPLLLCFEFHLRFLTIHPFTDGNGRTARLLTNLLLVSLSFPPFWVQEGSEKDAYNRYLADVQTYEGDPDLFYLFMAELVERSLNLFLEAIEGKEIDDQGDWKKKVQLFKQGLSKDDAFRATRDSQTLGAVYQQSIRPTIEALMNELTVYDDLFLKKSLWVGNDQGTVKVERLAHIDSAIQSNPMHDSLVFIYQLEGFKKNAMNPFQVKSLLKWNLGEYDYGLLLLPQSFKKPYDVFYGPDEISEIVAFCGDHLLREIEERM